MASIWLRRPPEQTLAAPVQVGQRVPSSPDLAATTPWRLVAFVRHVGCPFAEHTVKVLRVWAEAHPDVTVFVVSHGDPASTHAWLDAIGGAGRIRLVIDPTRGLHGQWGVGYARLWHFAGPRSLLGVMRLWTQGIHNRSASGTRWQRAATFLIGGDRVVWRHQPSSAEGFSLPPDTLLSKGHTPFKTRRSS